jgi:serpin B
MPNDMPNDLAGPACPSPSRKTRGLRVSLASLVLAACASFSACGGSGGGAPVGVEQSSQPRVTNPTVSSDDATTLANGNQAFAVDLYQQLRGQAGGDDNLIFSPVSISLALAMLYNGAATDTATQMATTLHFTLPTDRLNAAFDALDLALTAPPASGSGSFQLSLANAAWTQTGFPILPAYLDALAENYGAGIHTVDFESAPDAARTAVNAWVASQTQNQIPSLFPQGSIDNLTRLVLANAVYFHGDWVTPFDSNSQNATFHAQAGDVSVPMMTSKNPNAELWSGTGWQAASLSYVGATASMILVVPDAGTFAAFEQSVTADSLGTILFNKQQTYGALSMPRFKFSLATSLNDTLAALGMPDAFDVANADFSGIDGMKDLHVQTVVHQADIAVDEKGTTAAAATGIGVGDAAAVLNSLTIDRPFLFFIVHQSTGALLFAGRVVDPSTTN